MGKFKVGDKVRVRDDWDDNSIIMQKLVKGKSYEVVKTQDSRHSSGEITSLYHEKKGYSSSNIIKIQYPNGDTEWFGEGWFVKDRTKEGCVSCHKPLFRCDCKDASSEINDGMVERPMFKEGDKVTMGDDWSNNKSLMGDLHLTFGKTYVVLNSRLDDVLIKNDKGVDSFYAPSWFILDIYKDNRVAITKFIESCKWKPKDADKYWYIESWGGVYDDYYNGTWEDRMRYQSGNCFKTREQARGVAYKFKELLGER